MKSIKEKAKEIYPKTTATSDLCNEKFVEGANYALEEIEKLLNEFTNYEDSLIVRRVIEQLKK